MRILLKVRLQGFGEANCLRSSDFSQLNLRRKLSSAVNPPSATIRCAWASTRRFYCQCGEPVRRQASCRDQLRWQRHDEQPPTLQRRSPYGFKRCKTPGLIHCSCKLAALVGLHFRGAIISVQREEHVCFWVCWSMIAICQTCKVFPV